MVSAEKKRRINTSGKRFFDDNWEHESFFRHREYDQYFICHESVAEMKRYNVKRHYGSKHKTDVDRAYPRKG